MGYDKADLGWVVHYQAPGSVIAYYQQVGRAGRGVDHAEVVLLRGAEDKRIQDFFISTAFPKREHVEAVLDALPATTRQISSVVNLGTSRIDAMLKILDVEGAVTRSGTTWSRVDGADWHYDADRYSAVTELRRAEQAAMARLGVRRPLPDARAAGGARRPRSAATAAAAPSAPRRSGTVPWTRSWSAPPPCTCATGRSPSTPRRWRRTRAAR